MAPVISDAVLKLGSQSVAKIRLGSVEVWPPTTGVTLPAIGAAFEGGFYAGVISHTADGNPTHALIVAPRATGATGTGYAITNELAWKTSWSGTTGIVESSYDGVANTNSLIALGISDFPAAQFCVNLSIGGFTDWYLPSRYELDIAYKNLKPGTNNNLTDYGINPYSVPARAANHTTSDPAQTPALAFRVEGSEAFVNTLGGDEHLTSTHVPTADVWRYGFNGGIQRTLTVIDTGKVRAFRRIAL